METKDSIYYFTYNEVERFLLIGGALPGGRIVNPIDKTLIRKKDLRLMQSWYKNTEGVNMKKHLNPTIKIERFFSEKYYDNISSHYAFPMSIDRIDNALSRWLRTHEHMKLSRCLEKSLYYVFNNKPLWAASWRWSFGSGSIAEIGRYLGYRDIKPFVATTEYGYNVYMKPFVTNFPNYYPEGAAIWLENNILGKPPYYFYNIFMKYFLGAPRCMEPFTVYRGEIPMDLIQRNYNELIPYKNIENLREGDVFTLHSIISTSLNFKVAECFTQMSKCCILVIEISKYYPILYVNPSEEEIILLPGTKMTVTKKDTSKEPHELHIQAKLDMDFWYR